MTKALVVRSGLATVTNNSVMMFGGRDGASATEANLQVQAPENLTLSNLRAYIAAGGGGTNTLTTRVAGANTALAASRAGTGALSNTANTVNVTAGQAMGLRSTDTGTDPRYLVTTVNMELASGHGCLHTAGFATGRVCDVPSATRYHAIAGNITTDGVDAVSIASTQFTNRAYDIFGSLQVRITANARLNASTFADCINGTDGTGLVTVGAGLTGIFTDIGFDDAIADGDLLNVSMTLGSGVEDLTMTTVTALLKATTPASELLAMGGTGNRLASATADIYPAGGWLTTGIAAASEATARVTPGFAATCRNLRCRVTNNTYTGAGAFNLLVNGTVRISVAITAGVTGAFENTIDTYPITATDEVSFSLTGGTSGDVIVNLMTITLTNATPSSVQPPRSMHNFRQRRVA